MSGGGAVTFGGATFVTDLVSFLGVFSAGVGDSILGFSGPIAGDAGVTVGAEGGGAILEVLGAAGG
jgi:hypothetical protein